MCINPPLKTDPNKCIHYKSLTDIYLKLQCPVVLGNDYTFKENTILYNCKLFLKITEKVKKSESNKGQVNTMSVLVFSFDLLTKIFRIMTVFPFNNTGWYRTYFITKLSMFTCTLVCWLQLGFWKILVVSLFINLHLILELTGTVLTDQQLLKRLVNETK